MSSIRFKHMPCTTGAFITSNVLWKPFLCIGLATQLHLYPMCFRNCAYYWSFGSLIAYYVNHPLYTPVSDLQMKIGFRFGLICQIANFYCHLILKNLCSPGGSGGYQISRGFLFNIVTCASYTTEIYQWLCFNIATQTVSGYVFLVVATFIMTNWALAKHRRLKKVNISCLCSNKGTDFDHLYCWSMRLILI